MADVDKDAPHLKELAVPVSEITDALDTRPSLLRRHASVTASQSAFYGRRGNYRFTSLQYAKGGTLLHRRSTEGTINEMAVEISPSEQFSRSRRTVRLKERIRHEKSIKRKGVKNSSWEDFKHVKWPKLKSKLQVALSYELWKVHMKQVEGNFGTAVVSYFILLRWLFLVNMAIFTFWFGFVCIPQFIWETSPGVTIKPHYQLACVSNTSAAYNCSNGPPSLYMYSMDTSVHNCTPPSNHSFTIRTCVIDKHIAVKESSVAITVWPLSYCSSMMAWKVCNTSIAPYVPWNQYAVDFITGHGTFNETVLFLGHYTNTTTIRSRSYHMPLVILVMTGVVYVISFVLLVYKMGEAYNESYIEFGSSKKVNYSNKIFSLWDYNITDPKVVKLKKAYNRTDLKEELASDLNRQRKETWTQQAKVIVLRICTNILVVLVLSGAAAAIIQATKWNLNVSLQKADAITQTLYGLVVPVVITTLNIVLPFMFDILARFEKFKTRSGEIKMTLLRSIFVRVSSLVVLIITDYTLIKCTQPGGTGVQGEADKCTLSGLDILGGVANASGTASTSCRVECWETFIGQDFYKLALTNCVVGAVTTLASETTKSVVHMLLYHRIKWRYIKPLFMRGTFNIPQSILDLIYTQLLLWLGFLFSPLQPIIILLTLFITFYVKKYSLMWNLEPERRGIFKAARTNLLFLFLLLIALFGALVFVGIAVAKFLPSSSCGPFRSKITMLQTITDLTDSIKNCNARLVLSFMQSTAFFSCVILALLIIIYALIVALRARNKKFELIKNQLILEGGDMAHLVGKMSAAAERLIEQRNQALKATPDSNITQPSKKGVTAPEIGNRGRQKRQQSTQSATSDEVTTSL